MTGNDATEKPAVAAVPVAAVAARPVIVWNGAQYAASSRELELELLRRDYGLDERMLQATLVPRYKRHRPQASARNVHVRRAASFRDTPTTTTTAAAAAPSSDWILRQGNSSVSQINFHPWSELGERKFSHFDLVPWRRTRSALDLSSAVDYSASPTASASASAAAEKSLRELQKLELRHNRRRLQRSARSTQQGLRRLVRVRLIFSIELRHKRMELLRQSALPMRVFEQRFALSENESAAYERILMDASAGVDQHVGYFSRRQATRGEGEAEEQLVVDFASETEEEEEVEEEGDEAQYATIAATQESSVENAKRKATKEEEETEPRGKSVESGAGEGERAEVNEKEATPASKVPCVKCRDVAIKLR